MEAWRKKKGLRRPVRYTVILSPMEREVLGNLAATVSEALMKRARSAPKDEFAELIGLPTGHKEPPKDPSLARLLPNFERDGDEAFEDDNAMLRSFHETDIIKAKLTNLQVVTQALGPDGGVNVALDEEEARAWVTAMNDLRLYVASGEGASTETQLLVDWLAFNQDSLLQAMMGD